MAPSTRAELARFIDHMLLRPEASREDVTRHCAEAREHGFHGVCVHGSRVDLAYSLLEESDLKVTALVGFPFGAADSDVKRYETEVAIDHGAQEIEMVINLGRLKEGDTAYVLRELRDIAEAAEERPVKVIVETIFLTPEEQGTVCELALDSGVHFVCTGTGIVAPATVAEVQSLRKMVGAKFGVKAIGRIDSLETALSWIEAGATRIGTVDSIRLISSLPK
jgi:deoxyribose-phosphate aldolase